MQVEVLFLQVKGERQLASDLSLTYVACDELRSVGSDLLYCEENIDLLFLLDALKDEICRTEQTAKLNSIPVRQEGRLEKTMRYRVLKDNRPHLRALHYQWSVTGGNVECVQLFFQFNQRVTGGGFGETVEKPPQLHKLHCHLGWSQHKGAHRDTIADLLLLQTHAQLVFQSNPLVDRVGPVLPWQQAILICATSST